jgi:hypothetical protein
MDRRDEEGTKQKTPPYSEGADAQQKTDCDMTTQNKDTRFLRAALRYAELGFRVFPLKPQGKEPLVKDWPNQATNDRNIIREWWTKYPNANIGILTGQYEHGYFCVLDFDPRNGGDWFDEVDEDRLPPTWVVITGGGYHDRETGTWHHGRHYYYRTKEPIPSKKRPDGVDIKGTGGYVVAPPSVHPNGNEYEWKVDKKLDEVPMGWLPNWAIYDTLGSDEGKGLWRMKPPIPEGTRHNYIVSLAGILWNAGLESDEIEKIIREAINLFQTTAGFDVENEVRRLIASLPTFRKYPQNLNYVLFSLPEDVAKIVTANSKKAQDIVLTKNSNSENPASENKTKNTNDKTRGAESNTKHKKLRKILLQEKWVWWNSKPYVLRRGRLLDYIAISGYINARFSIGNITKDDVENVFPSILEDGGISHFDGLLLPDDKLLYANVDGIEGLWGHYDKRVYCYPVSGAPLLVWDREEAPEGIYFRQGSIGLPIIPEKVLKDEDRNMATLIEYMQIIGDRLADDPLVVLCMFFPSFFGMGHAGYLLMGEASSGKSNFAKALAHLEAGRAWRTPEGNNIRDYMASLVGIHKTTYFDETKSRIKDILDLLKAKITGNEVEIRDLFKNQETSVLKLYGSVVISATKLPDYLTSDFLDRSFFICFKNKPGVSEEYLQRYVYASRERARAGLIELFRRAAREQAPEKVPSAIRFSDWYRWGYRLAKYLGIPEEYDKTAKYSKLEPMRASPFGFLVDFFRQETIEEGKPYKIGDIFVQARGMDTTSASELRSIYAQLGRNTGEQNDINTIAKAAGYEVKIEKQIIDKQKGKKVFVLIFNKRPEITLEEWIVRKDDEYNKRITNLAHIFKDVDSLLKKTITQVQNNEDSVGSVEEAPSSSANLEVATDAQGAQPDIDNSKDNDDDDPETPPTPDGGDDDDGGGGGGSGGGGGDHWDEGYEDDENEYEDTDHWDDVQFNAAQGQAAVNEDPPASDIIYEGEKISIDDVKRYVKLILTDFLEDPPNKKDQAIQKLTEYIDIVNEKLKEEDLHTAMQYIQSQINTIKMIALLNGKKIDFAEPYIPPSPKEVPVKAQSAPATAPPAPPPPKPPAPPITNHHSLESAPAPAPPAPPKPPPSPPPIQNQIPPPAPPAPPPEPPPKPASPRLNYQTDDDFLGFMYAQMKNIRRNGGGDNEVASYLLGLREEVAEYLRQKGLNHALFILEATLKSFFVARRM